MKKKGKKLVSLALTFAMIAGLTACGKGGNDGNGGSASSDSGLAKQYVYREQPLDLGVNSDSVGVNLLTLQDDTVYFLYEEYDYSGDGTESTLKLLTMKKDGTGSKTVELPKWKEGEEPEKPAASGGTDEPSDTPADGDGGVAVPLARTEEMLSSAIVEDVADASADGTTYGGYSYTSVSNCLIGADGNLYGIRNHYSEFYIGEEYNSTNDYALLCWDTDGNIVWEADLNDMQGEEGSYVWVYSMLSNADGSLTLLLSGDKWEKCTVTEEGISDRKDLPEAAATLFNNANTTINAGDGKLQVIYWDENNYTDMYIASYDAATDAVSEGVQLSDTFSNNGYSSLVPGDGDILYYSNSNGVFSYNIQTQEIKQIMSYINSDVATTSMNNFLILSDDQFIGFYYESSTGTTKGSLFTYVNPADIKDKKVLVLAGNYVDYSLKSRIVDYNKNNEDYRIVVKEYNSYNTSDDYTLGLKQLNNDIISGGMPDILIADTNIPMESYINKGLVANVDDLIAKDEELSQNEYLQNVWDAYRVNGKLYNVIPSFYIGTMVGKTSIFGDRTSITMDELQNIQAEVPEATALFGDTVIRENFLYTMMSFCGSDFVDVSTGKCAFDTDNFVAMLAYAGTLPEEYGEDYWGEDYWNDYQSQFRDNRTLLANTTISSIRDLNGVINGQFGEDVSFVGFPTDSGMGSIIWNGNFNFALSAKSGNLDGAWEFVRYYLTQEYQDTIQDKEYNLPVLRNSFEASVEAATEKPYYLDENGNKVEYDETYYINDEEIILPQLTKEQVDKIVSFVESVNKRAYYNEAITNIISEEAGAYFSGQKSARDVAGVIQSRVQVYVNENR